MKTHCAKHLTKNPQTRIRKKNDFVFQDYTWINTLDSSLIQYLRSVSNITQCLLWGKGTLQAVDLYSLISSLLIHHVLHGFVLQPWD